VRDQPNGRLRSNGLASGSKALESSLDGRLRLSDLNRRSSSRETAAALLAGHRSGAQCSSEHRVAAVEVNGRKAQGVERRHGSERGKSSEGMELQERSGTKQGRVARRGGNRQEGEKP